MRIELQKSPFLNQHLTIEPGGFFNSTKLFQHGRLISRNNGFYIIKNENGADIQAKLIVRFYDPIPKLKIGNETIELFPPFRWYELTWILLPFFALFPFGAIGGFGGVASSMIAGRIFRSNQRAMLKYFLSGVCSTGILIATFLLAIYVGAFLNSLKN